MERDLAPSIGTEEQAQSRDAWIAIIKKRCSCAFSFASKLAFPIFLVLWLFFVLWIPLDWVRSSKSIRESNNGTNATGYSLGEARHTICSEKDDFSFAKYNMGYSMQRANEQSTAGKSTNFSDVLANEENDDEYFLVNKEQDCVVRPLEQEEIQSCMRDRWLLTFGNSDPGVITNTLIKVVAERGAGIAANDVMEYLKNSVDTFWGHYEIGFGFDKVGGKGTIACRNETECAGLLREGSARKKVGLISRKAVEHTYKIKDELERLKSSGLKDQRSAPELFILTGAWESFALAPRADWQIDRIGEQRAAEQNLSLRDFYLKEMEGLLTYIAAEWPEVAKVYLSTDWTNTLKVSEDWLQRPGWPAVHLYLEKPPGSRKDEMIADGHFTMRSSTLLALATLDGLCATSVSTARKESAPILAHGVGKNATVSPSTYFSTVSFLPECYWDTNASHRYYDAAESYGSMCRTDSSRKYLENPIRNNKSALYPAAKGLEKLIQDVDQHSSLQRTIQASASGPAAGESGAETAYEIGWTVFNVLGLLVGAIRAYGLDIRAKQKFKQKLKRATSCSPDQRTEETIDLEKQLPSLKAPQAQPEENRSS
jgi:hypothetical protein